MAVAVFMTSCYQESLTVEEGNTGAITHESDNFSSYFIDDYKQYSQAFTGLKNSLNNDYWANGTIDNSPFLINTIGDEDNKDDFLGLIKRHGAEFENLEFSESIELLLSKEAISTKQSEFLLEVERKLYELENAKATQQEIYTFVVKRFDSRYLNHLFNENDAITIQFFGFNLLYNLEEIYNSEEPDISMRDCGWTQPVRTALCALAATAAVVAVGYIVHQTGTALYLQEVCEILELNIDPVYCELALAVGIWGFVYDWCCGNIDVPCAESQDPCCDVDCPPGQRCNGQGNCEFDPFSCFNINCGEGYTCFNGACVQQITCVFDYHCLGGEQCLFGDCYPI